MRFFMAATQNSQALKDLYTRLTPIQRLSIARHPNRPTVLDHILNITEKVYLLNIFSCNQTVLTKRWRLIKKTAYVVGEVGGAPRGSCRLR